MSEKFQNLIKIPEQPAARLLAIGNTKIEMKLKAPVSATVAVVLGELEKMLETAKAAEPKLVLPSTVKAIEA